MGQINKMEVWNQLERMRTLVGKCEGRTKSAGISAIDHIVRAKALIEIDPQMACFRAICAEEEAATSLLASIKGQGYPQSELIHLYSHPNKAAVIIFVAAVIDWFHKRFIADGLHFGTPRLMFTDEPGRKAIELLLPLLGTDKAVHPRPPLDVRVENGATLQDMIGESVQLKLKQTLASEIKGAISVKANQRNLLLYASDKNLPGLIAKPEQYVINQAGIVNALLTAVGMVDPWCKPNYPHSEVVKSAVLEFVRIMRAVDASRKRNPAPTT